MPYASKAQQRFFNSPTGVAKIGQSKVDEFNAATKDYGKLPEKKGGVLSSAARKAGASKSAPSQTGALGSRFKKQQP